LSRPLIEFRSVFKAYWKKPPKKSGASRKKTRHVVLEDCTAEFPRGRSVAILGEKGAGKTTLLRLIAGSEFPDRGRVLKHGSMAPLGGFPGLSRVLSARENCRFVARLYGIEIRNLERFIEEFTDLGPQFNNPVGTYTKAMRSRVSLGLLMAPDFDCYLFDGGIWFGDAAVRERARAVFDAKRQSASLVLASNSPTQIRAYCDMGAILHDGRLHLFDDVEEAIRAFQDLGGMLVEGEVEAPDEPEWQAREAEEDRDLF
jgi:capsular polysaccharide transport system ATP-binding protein